LRGASVRSAPERENQFALIRIREELYLIERFRKLPAIAVRIEDAQSLLNQRRRDGAAVDSEVRVRPALLIRKFGGVAIDMEPSAIALSHRLGIEQSNVGDIWQMRALQCFAQDLLLDLQLLVIRRVLVVASAAFTKILARRWHACRGRFDDADQFRLRIAAAVASDLSFHGFAGQREGNEDRFALRAREAGSAIDTFLDG
jgi:hypothetical protein